MLDQHGAGSLRTAITVIPLLCGGLETSESDPIFWTNATILELHALYYGAHGNLSSAMSWHFGSGPELMRATVIHAREFTDAFDGTYGLYPGRFWRRSVPNN